MTKIGLLPLYIELYDQIASGIRPRLEGFYEVMAKALETQRFEVLRCGFCRTKPEFEEAVSGFERGGAQCLITLHMAYSPSLESSEVLAKTRLPIVVLDVTDTFDFSSEQKPDAIDYCHGIHGVMDMCSLLRYNGKPFAIAAGYPSSSDVMERTSGFIKAAVSACSLAESRVGIIGGAFKGMGDFAVTAEEMQERFGVTVVAPDNATMRGLSENITDSEIKAEISFDLKAFSRIGGFTRERHVMTARDGLAVRKWIKDEKLSAFTVNFLEIGAESGLTVMPFMEACKAMSRGTGYAGEGDVLTAAFTGALMRGFPDTSFVEVFCPDWQGGSLFLSHMGEMNIRLAAGKPEIAEKNFVFGNGVNPVACYGCFRSGGAVFVNVFRGRNGFGLLVAPVKMEEETTDNFAGIIRGWMRPNMPVHTFLEQLSKAGATHHSILVYDATPEQMRFFGELLGLEVVELYSCAERFTPSASLRY